MTTIRYCLLISLLASLALLCSCDQFSKENPIEISFFTMQLRPAFDDYFHEIIADYENSHPGIKIRWLDQPFQNYETKLVTSFIAKHSPDVLNLSSDTVHTFGRAGFIAEIKPLLPPETLEVYLPNSLIEKGCLYQGRVYSLPWYVSSAVTMCNKKIFKEAGIDLEEAPRYNEELPAICRTIRERTDKFGFFPTYTESGSLNLMILNVGDSLLDESKTRAAFNTPEVLYVFKTLTDLYKDGLVPSEALTASHRRPIELFKSGKLAIFFSGPQFLRQVKSDAPDVYENTLIGPQLIWKGYPIYKIDMHTMSISAQSKHPKEAAEFAAYVTNLENQIKFCKLTTIFPSVTKGLEDPFFTEVEDTPQGHARKIAAQQVKMGFMDQPPPKRNKIFSILDDVTEKVCLNKISAQEGLDEAEEQINEILQP